MPENASTSPTTQTRFPAIALWMTLLVLAVLNVLLIRQNLQMRAALDKLKPDILQKGDKVPPFNATGLHGEAINIGYTCTGPKRVFLFFTPNCPYCREQFSYWQQLLEHTADAKRFEVIGLVKDAEDKAALEAYLRRFNCGDSSTPLRVALVSETVRRGYKLSATPITLIAASDGRIEKVWDGRWDAAALADAASTFGVNFSQR